MRNFIKIFYRKFHNVIISKGTVLNGSLNNIHKSNIRFTGNAHITLGKNVIIRNCTINVLDGDLIIGDDSIISNYNIYIGSNCRLYLGHNCLLEHGDNWRDPYISLSDGSSCIIEHHNRIRCDIWCRFGGSCYINEYNCINERTEIRCDENVSVGSFNMISYNCRIWDTNTHSFYDNDNRREMTIKMYPIIGAEIHKPQTKPVFIGDDCLIGESSVILKGTRVGNKCIVGTRSVAAGLIAADFSKIVGNPAIIV